MNLYLINNVMKLMVIMYMINNGGRINNKFALGDKVRGERTMANVSNAAATLQDRDGYLCHFSNL